MEFWDPLHISATVEAINSKFGTQNDREDPYHKKNENFGKKGSPGGHVTIFENYGTASISRQRQKLEIRNLACSNDREDPYRKNENFGKNWSLGVI